MSTVEIYAVRKSGDVELYAEVENSHRGMQVVWREMESRYLPLYRPSFVPDYVDDNQLVQYLHYKPTRVSALEEDAMKEVWNLINLPNVSLLEKWVLGSTYDKVIVERSAFDDLIHAFHSFFSDPDASNLPEQADIVEQMTLDEDIIGIAWSISQIGSPWVVKKKIKPTHELWEEADIDWDWDEDEGEEQFRFLDIPYNTNKGDIHWFLNREEQMNPKV